MTRKECFELSRYNCRYCSLKGKDSCIRLKTLNQESAENLLVAIVAQAAKDYRIYRRMAYMKPRDTQTQVLFKRAADFFLSDYFLSMTKLDGKAILEQLEKEPLITDEQLSEYGDADE